MTHKIKKATITPRPHRGFSIICTVRGKSSTPEAETTPDISTTLNTLDELSSDMQTNQEKYRAEVDPEEEISTGDTLSKETANKILIDYGRKNNCTTTDAIIGITKLIQDGGANASKTNLKRKINGILFDINDLRDTIKFHDKSGTVRKFAKTLRDSISYIALINNWTGPLLKDLMRSEPQLEITNEESIWCNEIHSDNYAPSVPPRIREALQRREHRIREQNKSVDNKKKNKKVKNKNNKK